MAYFSHHPTRPIHPWQQELWMFLIAVLLLGMAIVLIQLLDHLPAVERTVPQPVIATAISAQTQVPVSFSKLQGSQSITETTRHIIPMPGQGTPLRLALQQLLNGPTQAEKEQGYYSEIPSGTQLISLKETPTDVIINLSRHFTDGGGSTSILQRVAELQKTVQATHSAQPIHIHIQVEGRPLHVLGGEGLELSE